MPWEVGLQPSTFMPGTFVDMHDMSLPVALLLHIQCTNHVHQRLVQHLCLVIFLGMIRCSSAVLDVSFLCRATLLRLLQS